LRCNALWSYPAVRMGIARKFIDYNRRACEQFDQILPARFRVDGNTHFQRNFAPAYLRPQITVFDIGGGKQPLLSERDKQKYELRLVGIDISLEELNRAPVGVYDEVVAEDIARYTGRGDADLVICQALLEHVQDVPGAFRAIASTLRPGGIACLFVPSRHAVFARLNLLLPSTVKKRLLFSIFPGSRDAQGFPSYYDRCTPDDFKQLAAQNGLEVVEFTPYFLSRYFTFFAPAHLLWRAWQVAFLMLQGSQAAETFSIALRKV